ncbi:MAG: hypothetical protein ACK4TV_11650 [Comamonas testosteroni]|jgi:hypothetical protein
MHHDGAITDKTWRAPEAVCHETKTLVRQAAKMFLRHENEKSFTSNAPSKCLKTKNKYGKNVPNSGMHAPELHPHAPNLCMTA